MLSLLLLNTTSAKNSRNLVPRFKPSLVYQRLRIRTLTCCLEGPGGNDETLEEHALLKVESLLQRGRHVGRSDSEGDGDETLFQDVVYFEVAHNTPLPAEETRN